MVQLRRTLVAAWKQASATQAPLLGAGVAFYAFLSLFPAMIAAVMTYGLVADPATVQRQADRLADALPPDAASVVTGQLESLVETGSGSLGLGLVLALALALWSASGGVGNLVTAVNRVFGYTEDRGFVKLKALALGLTGGAIVFMLVLLGLVAAVPALLNGLVDSPGVRALLEVARVLVLLGAVVLAVGVLFRLAPNRPHGDLTPLVSTGSLVAAALWTVASLGFSLYVTFFGSYGATYGALAGVVVLLLWLWVGVYALLLGAAVEAVREEAPVEPEAAEAADVEAPSYDADDVPARTH